MRVTAVYFAEAAACGLMTMSTVHPSRALAALRSAPPAAGPSWPAFHPLRDQWNLTKRTFGHVSLTLYAALVAYILANTSEPEWLRTLVSVTVLYVGAAALVRLTWGGARFGILYGRIVRAHPELTVLTSAASAAAVVLGALSLILQIL